MECEMSMQESNEDFIMCSEHGQVKSALWKGEKVCPYHQRVGYDSEGVPYMMWDEFNQDGEEW